MAAGEPLHSFIGPWMTERMRLLAMWIYCYKMSQAESGCWQRTTGAVRDGQHKLTIIMVKCEQSPLKAGTPQEVFTNSKASGCSNQGWWEW
jgi:hypothetical protein